MSTRKNQIAAVYQVVTPRTDWTRFFRPSIEEHLTTERGDPTPADDIKARRTFLETAQVLHVVSVVSPSCAQMQISLDGWETICINVDRVTIIIDAKKANTYPVAEVEFSGDGMRYSNLSFVFYKRIGLFFADKDQLDRFMTKHAVPDPPVTHVTKNVYETRDEVGCSGDD